MTSPDLVKPHFPRGVRLRYDAVRERQVLLYPEGALALNDTATAVLELCDGERTIAQIADELRTRYGADVLADVQSLVDAIASRGLLLVD